MILGLLILMVPVLLSFLWAALWVSRILRSSGQSKGKKAEGGPGGRS